jgi:hypothetical protein
MTNKPSSNKGLMIGKKRRIRWNRKLIFMLRLKRRIVVLLWSKDFGGFFFWGWFCGFIFSFLFGVWLCIMV